MEGKYVDPDEVRWLIMKICKTKYFHFRPFSVKEIEDLS